MPHLTFISCPSWSICRERNEDDQNDEEQEDEGGDHLHPALPLDQPSLDTLQPAWNWHGDNTVLALNLEMNIQMADWLQASAS